MYMNSVVIQPVFNHLPAIIPHLSWNRKLMPENTVPTLIFHINLRDNVKFPWTIKDILQTINNPFHYGIFYPFLKILMLSGL